MTSYKKPKNTSSLQRKGYRTKASGGKKVIPRASAICLALVAFYIGLHAPSFSNRRTEPAETPVIVETETETES